MTPLNPAQQEFRRQAVDLSRRIAPLYGLDWRLMAAAAILESGWGESALARGAHNYFGIRALSRTPKEEVFELAQRQHPPARFRKFKEMEDAFHAYGRLLSESRHYEKARQACTDTRRAFEPFHELLRETLLHTFLLGMAPVYCPDDPDYVSKILQIIDHLGREER